MELFDSHCHLEDERFVADRADVIGRMQDEGITRCVCAGSDLDTSYRIVDLAKSFKSVYAAVGVHPHEAKTVPDDYLVKICALFSQEKVVALGEIGLDYYYDHSPRDLQKNIFLEQMDLALALDVPVIFHIRDAHGDVLDIFRSKTKKLPKGIIHCYSGSAETASEYVKMGFYISFGGAITFKNASKLRKAACSIPLDKLLIETDSPYLAPEPLRGRRNEPANVRYVCTKLAELREMQMEEIAQITTRNALDIYGIKS